MGATASMEVGGRGGNLQESSSCTLWVPGIKLRSAGLAAHLTY